jgi:CRISPR/Cas system-associated exonuclease Cas4 (RecB family)
MHYFNINKGIILVENKDSQELKEFIVEKDEKLLQEISAKFTSLKKMVDSNTLPLKPKFRNDEKWKCDYCQYRKTCEENG